MDQGTHGLIYTVSKTTTEYGKDFLRIIFLGLSLRFKGRRELPLLHSGDSGRCLTGEIINVDSDANTAKINFYVFA